MPLRNAVYFRELRSQFITSLTLGRLKETSEAAVVSAEPAQLQQVILNLCNNAAQAMDEAGDIEIRIEVRKLTEPLRVGRIDIGPGSFAIVSISDPGRGMEEATLERIFEPFFTTRPDGNGLGLATVREIVEEHDGAVAVASTPGVGTRFDIWLPSVSSNERISIQHSPGVAGRGAGETVLVLESRSASPSWLRRRKPMPCKPVSTRHS
jgi:signal transduction histidine kinase